MNYELLKNTFIKLKKEEIEYIDFVNKISTKKILTENEKLNIYRTVKNYQIKINEVLENLKKIIIKEKEITSENLKEVIVEFDIEETYLSNLDIYYRNTILEEYFGINLETFSFQLTLFDLIYKTNNKVSINLDIIQNGQKLLEKPIYIFCGYDDFDDYYLPSPFPSFKESDYGLYEILNEKEKSSTKKVLKKEINNFEKDNIIINRKKYVNNTEIRKIFEEELLNIKNINLNDCVEATVSRIEKLNYVRSPEYKEKLLLNKINELYKKVKGEFLEKEVLYEGNFLKILRETYKLPNKKIVKKEKIIRNNGKNSVIILAITQDNDYIITFQNRIKDKIIAEFPSGYIENNETPIEAAKRELLEETGYISDDLFVIDEAFTSLGIENSVTYIVVANKCIKFTKSKNTNTELVNYGLFKDLDLKYLIKNNIINGALNKLAYYNLINNIDDIINKKIYKK